MPPPPAMCLPFMGKQKKRRLSWSTDGSQATQHHLTRHPSQYSEGPMQAADSITFHSDSEKYDDLPDTSRAIELDSKGRPKLSRGNTMTGTKKSTASSKWGYGWGTGKKAKDDDEDELLRQPSKSTGSTLPVYQTRAPTPPVRRDSKSSHASKNTARSQDTYKTQDSHKTQDSSKTQDTYRSRNSGKSKDTQRTYHSTGSEPKPRPPIKGSDSTSTLVGSTLERKMAGDVESIPDRAVDTTERLTALRAEMEKNTLDYYVVPHEDAHGSEYVAASDKRQEYITGFTGSSGLAVITKAGAYLTTDSRYWEQARTQTDRNWEIIKVGAGGRYIDWIEFFVKQLFKGARIGIDARMISHEKAASLNTKLNPLDCKLIFPPQNLIDLIWKDKPLKPRGTVYVQSIEYTGKDATYKLYKLKEWIREQPAAVPSYSKSEPTPQQMHVGTLVTSLHCIAWILNLRGTDIPFNPLFHAYLFVGLDRTIVFLDSSKVDEPVIQYLEKMNVERRDYTDLWPFLRKREWGEGKLLISPSTSYAISLMLTHFRYTVAPNRVESMMAIKNEREIEGIRRAYIRDGVAFVRFLAWLENKLNAGYEISEWEAAWRIKEFRMKQSKFMGLAYETTSATGPNAALPHYVAKKHTARILDRDTPYLNDSGGQYRDGTCDTTRTLIFGKPTPDMCDAYTRVLQGHIAIDTAVFPEGTSGHQLDVLARKALWRNGLNYLHGTGHGFGSFLTVHEGDHGFSSHVGLKPGHVITNEPGFYREGKWGIRIESALVVKRVKTKHEFNGDIWLGFERLTVVPIQTRMIKENMLTKEERNWIKEHNSRCWDVLSPFLKEDKVAMKWLRREVDRGIGIVNGPGGMSIEWD